MFNDVDISFNPSGSNNPDTSRDVDSIIEAINLFLEKYTELAVILLGLSVFFLVGVLIFNTLRLSSVGGDTRERKKVLVGIVINLVAVAILGSITLFVGIFYNAFR